MPRKNNWPASPAFSSSGPRVIQQELSQKVGLAARAELSFFSLSEHRQKAFFALWVVYKFGIKRGASGFH